MVASLVLLWVFPAEWGYFRVGSVGRRAVKGASLLYLVLEYIL